ncbi:unnamed protein product [Kuraishia capsulata CBS 1993]|uniref:Uncharacterized protein n=1 Tax=Kuraishia capsulata CBS 1993 TaxID=1382522 RepID=W6MJA2_9ASCO|nr:uncharacterized protein KUCA_T00002572001 [Kuraishia capsulata CBS 1993]CDK26599.1 unnamed protein product [Kuraishia capsulata CBS 1993]
MIIGNSLRRLAPRLIQGRVAPHHALIRRSIPMRYSSSSPSSSTSPPKTPWTESYNISNTIEEINKEHDLLETLSNTPTNHEVIPILEHKDRVTDTNEKLDGYSADLQTEKKVIEDDLLDTYKIYSELKESGFSDEQADLILNMLIEALSEKLGWLENKFSPKVDLENESYLFHAAQSELLVEISKSRDSSMNELTNSSIQLKRLFNSLEDELAVQYNLNENAIKMDINQFKHENNLHNKQLNLKNHDLNSKITGEMISGIKSDVESLRWHITMAGIFAILVMVFSLVSGGSLARFVRGEKEEKEEKEEEEELAREKAREILNETNTGNNVDGSNIYSNNMDSNENNNQNNRNIDQGTSS